MSSTILKTRIKLVCFYFQIDECRNLFEIPLIIYSGENTWSVKIPPQISNHKKPDTGLVFHAGTGNKIAVGSRYSKEWTK